MVQQIDEIVDIPPHRVRYFGRQGKMLLPSPATIAAVIAQVPEHKLLTTDLLRKKLTAQFEVEGTCPITTKNSLRFLANDADQEIAYWRVIQQNGGLITFYPGGVRAHAAHLQSEGFTINTVRKLLRVDRYTDSLIRFA